MSAAYERHFSAAARGVRLCRGHHGRPTRTRPTRLPGPRRAVLANRSALRVAARMTLIVAFKGTAVAAWR